MKENWPRMDSNYPFSFGCIRRGGIGLGCCCLTRNGGLGGGALQNHELYQLGSRSLSSSASSGEISQSTILSASQLSHSVQDNKLKTKTIMMENIPEEPERKVDMHQIRIKAWKLCRNYLTGVWKQVKAEDLILEEIW